jgi:hypothetical protein
LTPLRGLVSVRTGGVRDSSARAVFERTFEAGTGLHMWVICWDGHLPSLSRGSPWRGITLTRAIHGIVRVRVWL